MWVLLRYEARVAYTTMHVYEIPEISVQKKILLWNNTHKIYKIEKFFSPNYCHIENSNSLSHVSLKPV